MADSNIAFRVGKIRLTREHLLWILTIALGTGAVTIVVYQTYLQFRDAIEFGASLIVGVLTVAGLVLTAESIERGIQERRESAAFAFIARYNSPDFFDHILRWKLVHVKISEMTDGTRVVDLIEGISLPQAPRQRPPEPPVILQIFNLKAEATPPSPPPEESELDAYKRTQENRLIAVQMFNFFEEIAIALSSGAADEKTLREYFEGVLPAFYRPAWP